MDNPMRTARPNLIDGGRLRLDILARLYRRPELFAPGEPLFWDDPHISQQMLQAHLDPASEAASRPPHVIDASAAWIVNHLGLRPGQRVLDLGCGPGLYAIRLAERGLRVTGVDISRRSIAFARQQAGQRGLAIDYRCADFLTLDDEAQFDAALQVYGEFGTLTPASRDDLFRRVARALKPGGRLVFDVSTRQHRQQAAIENRWYAVAGPGFWKQGDHLVLEHGFDYPEADAHLDQYIVIEADGAITVFRNWFIDYTVETITAAVKAQGFAIESVWGDLCGQPYRDGSEWIGVVAVRR
jgi:SAM-dependent methyltransferase